MYKCILYHLLKYYMLSLIHACKSFMQTYNPFLHNISYIYQRTCFHWRRHLLMFSLTYLSTLLSHLSVLIDSIQLYMNGLIFVLIRFFRWWTCTLKSVRDKEIIQQTTNIHVEKTFVLLFNVHTSVKLCDLKPKKMYMIDGQQCL